MENHKDKVQAPSLWLSLIPLLLLGVFLVFVICLVADRCRALLFLGVKHILCRGWIHTLLKKADACINGDSRSAEHAAERK